MINRNWNNTVFRGVFQSSDGVISKVIESKSNSLRFEAAFNADTAFIEKYQHTPEHFVFSETFFVKFGFVKINQKGILSLSLC